MREKKKEKKKRLCFLVIVTLTIHVKKERKKEIETSDIICQTVIAPCLLGIELLGNINKVIETKTIKEVKSDEYTSSRCR